MDRTRLSFLSLSLSLSDLGKNLVLGRPEAWAPWDLFPRLLAPTRLGKSCSTNRQPHQALERRAGRKRESPRQSPQPATRGAEAALPPPSPVPALVSSLVLGGRLRAQGIQRTAQQANPSEHRLSLGLGLLPTPCAGLCRLPTALWTLLAPRQGLPGTLSVPEICSFRGKTLCLPEFLVLQVTRICVEHLALGRSCSPAGSTPRASARLRVL